MPSRIPKYSLQLVRCGSVSALDRHCSGPRDVADLFRAFVGDPDREHVVAMYLDTQNRFLGVHLVAVGTIDAALVNPGEVYKAGLLCNAHAVVLAHNHVSGEPAPSPPDECLTQRIALAGDILGIHLVDHVVVGQPGLVSLAQLGCLPELVSGLYGAKGATPRRKRAPRSSRKGAVAMLGEDARDAGAPNRAPEVASVD